MVTDTRWSAEGATTYSEPPLGASEKADSTARNLAANGKVRLTLGETRDVVLIEGVATRVTPAAEVAAAFAERTGFDPRAEATPYRWFRIFPCRIQAWREVDELPERELMRDGRWSV